MSELYKTIMSLCDEKGISGYRLCKDIGIRPSVLTDLKMGRQSGLSAANAQKISNYFGISVGYLLGEETKNAPAQEDKRISDNDIKFALFKGDGEITDAMLDEVKAFAAFVQQREANKEKK